MKDEQDTNRGAGIGASDIPEKRVTVFGRDPESVQRQHPEHAWILEYNGKICSLVVTVTLVIDDKLGRRGTQLHLGASCSTGYDECVVASAGVLDVVEMRISV